MWCVWRLVSLLVFPSLDPSGTSGWSWSQFSDLTDLPVFRLYDEHVFICYSSLFSKLKAWPRQVAEGGLQRNRRTLPKARGRGRVGGRSSSWSRSRTGLCLCVSHRDGDIHLLPLFQSSYLMQPRLKHDGTTFRGPLCSLVLTFDLTSISFASFSPFSNLHFIIVSITNTAAFCVGACLRKIQK